MVNDDTSLSTANTRLTLSASNGGVSEAVGRYLDSSDFGSNVLAGPGIHWRVITGMHEPDQHVVEDVITTDESTTAVMVSSDAFGPVSRSRWTLTADGRGIRVDTELELLRPARASAVLVEIPAPHWFLLGLFERGVVQQVRYGRLGFASRDELEVFYTMDTEGGSLSVVPHGSTQTILRRDEPTGAVGVQLVQLGDPATHDAWTETLWGPQHEVSAGQRFGASFTIYANDLPFPSHAVDHLEFDSVNDARTHLTALYGSVMGVLGGYAVKGSAYPTLNLPERNYWSLHTFFDPDAWSTVGTLANSGTPSLEREARRILERALSGITADGQLPHHFDVQEPLYLAIAGVPQTGPNIFWTLSALDYVTATGDDAWLREVWATGMKPAVDWVLEAYVPERKLLSVIGPLWVDVFKREGFTFDTNAAAVHLLRQVADAADFLGEPSERYRDIANEITVGLEQLWDGDHYVTERSRDWSQVRDLIDSESYLAVAFGLVDPERAQVILDRMDRIPNIHPGGRGTWVSEVYYSVDDCHLGNTGDSATAMGRHWWVDLAARVAVGDVATFTTMYTAVRDDLFTHTWLTERYGVGGTQIRAAAYHEYPEILDKMLREGVYGLRITLRTVELIPMRAEPFRFTNGRLTAVHTGDSVEVMVPGSGERAYIIGGLEAGREYRVGDATRATADASGVVCFSAEAGVPISVRPAQ